MMRLLVVLLLAAFALCASQHLSSCLKDCKIGKQTFQYCKLKCLHPNFNKEMGDILADQSFRTELESLMSDAELDDPVIDKDKLWDQMREGLRSIFTLNTPSDTLRISNKYIDASSWVNPLTFDAFCDWPPVFSSSYMYDQQESWKKAYGDWLNSIKLPDQASKLPATLKQLGRDINAMLSEVDDEDQACKTLWASRDSNYELFRQNRCFSYNTALKESDNARLQYRKKLREFYGDFAELSEAITRFTDHDRSKPSWELLEDINHFVKRSEQNQTNAFKLEITKNSASSVSKWSSFSVGVGVSIPAGAPAGLPTGSKKDAGGQPTSESDYRAMDELDILSDVFSASNQVSFDFNYGQNKTRTTTKVSNYKMNIGADGYQYFHVRPSPNWYTPGIIRQYLNYPYSEGRNKEQFFGIKGRIPLMTKGMFIVTKPTFTIFMSKDEKESIEKRSGFGVEVGYGPVHVKADSQKGLKTDDAKDGSYSVAFTSTNPDPQVWSADVFIMDPDMEKKLLASPGK